MDAVHSSSPWRSVFISTHDLAKQGQMSHYVIIPKDTRRFCAQQLTACNVISKPTNVALLRIFYPPPPFLLQLKLCNPGLSSSWCSQSEGVVNHDQTQNRTLAVTTLQWRESPCLKHPIQNQLTVVQKLTDERTLHFPTLVPTQLLCLAVLRQPQARLCAVWTQCWHLCAA